MKSVFSFLGILGLSFAAIGLLAKGPAWMSVGAAQPPAEDRGAVASSGPCAKMNAPARNDLIRISGGWFWMGDDQGQEDERPRRRVRVAAFSIQHHEVTWAEYCTCVQAGRCAAPKGRGKVGADLPVTGVSFHDARSYCSFLGLSLPTERQWEKAAAGPEGLRFPWGNRPDCRMANYGTYDGQGPCVGVNPGGVIAVASRKCGSSPYGVADMAGNVWEWAKDRRGNAVLRGGSCCSIFLLPRAANRLSLPASYRDSDIGFRCVGSFARGRRPRPSGGAGLGPKSVGQKPGG